MPGGLIDITLGPAGLCYHVQSSLHLSDNAVVQHLQGRATATQPATCCIMPSCLAAGMHLAMLRGCIALLPMIMASRHVLCGGKCGKQTAKHALRPR